MVLDGEVIKTEFNIKQFVEYDPDETRNWKLFRNFVGKVAIVVATAVVSAVATPISLPVALAVTAVVTVAANHIDNAIKIDRAKKEVDSMSDDELDQYLSNIYIDDYDDRWYVVLGTFVLIAFGKV